MARLRNYKMKLLDRGWAASAQTLMVLTGLIVFIGLPENSWAHGNEKNKEVVTSFYKLAFVNHKAQEAVDKYIGSKYIQHNPNVPDGSKAFLDFFIPFFEKHPEARSEIKRVVAEGDLVVLQVLSKIDKADRGNAIVDIFRVENGKIVEHWDVRQPIPEKSANTNTMF